MLGRGFHTIIKNASFPSPTDVGSHNPSPFRAQHPRWHSSLLQSMWDPPIHPPSGPSVLAGTPPHVHPPSGLSLLVTHSPMSGSDTICNGPSPPLADIVLFRLSLSGFPQGFQNASTRERFPHPYKESSSPTDVGSHTTLPKLFVVYNAAK